MNGSRGVWVGVALGAVAAATWLAWIAWRRSAEAASAVAPVVTPATNPSPPTSDRTLDLEPDADWGDRYAERFLDAVATCVDDPSVVAFDHAVLRVLETIFPESGSFALTPATGDWKRIARDQARLDLTQALGATEVEARCSLCLPVGQRLLAAGADPGQAVRAMATHAFPAASWNGPTLTPWQQAFCDCALARLSAARRGSQTVAHGSPAGASDGFASVA